MRSNGETIDRTVGRPLLNEIVPEQLGFVNQELKKKEVTALVGRCYNALGNEVTVQFLDELKDLGFRYATLSGLSIGIDDMHVPTAKGRHIAEARHPLAAVDPAYPERGITPRQRLN